MQRGVALRVLAVWFLASWLGNLAALGANNTDSDQDEALLAAAVTGDSATTRTLLRSGANPNARREDGSTLTALMLAARGGHSSVVRMLLDAGALPDATAAVSVGVNQVNEGITALMLAAASGDAKTMRLLIDFGANAKARDSAGNTLLHYAVEKMGAAEVVGLAVGQGVDRLAQNIQGQTALDKARASNNTAAVAELMP